MKNTKMMKSMLAIGLGMFLTGMTVSLYQQPEARANAVQADIPAHFAASLELEQQGKTDQALTAVLEILKLDAFNYVANLRAGWLSYLTGQYDQSISYYEIAARLEVLAIEPDLGLLLPLMATKRWDEAATLAEQIVRDAPGQYTAASRLAYIYFEQGKYSKAEEQYSRLLTSYPGDLEMMLGLGWTYLRQERRTDARHQFEAVLSINPENAGAKAGMAAL